jgi:hypothetical protein
MLSPTRHLVLSRVALVLAVALTASRVDGVALYDRAQQNRALVAAVIDDDPATVAVLLKHGADSNLVLDSSRVKLLASETYISRTLPGRRRGSYSCSILHLASEVSLPMAADADAVYDGIRHNTEIVDLLLEHGAHVNSRDRLGRTALMLAAWRLRLGNVRQLLQRGADPSVVDTWGDSASSKLLWTGWEFPNYEGTNRIGMRRILDEAVARRREMLSHGSAIVFDSRQ